MFLIHGSDGYPLDDTYQLPVNKVHQLGFRIVKMVGGIPIAAMILTSPADSSNGCLSSFSGLMLTRLLKREW